MSLESTLNKLVAAIEDNTKAVREMNSVAASIPDSAPASATTQPEAPKKESAKAEPKSEPTPEPEAAGEASGVTKKQLTDAIIKLAKTKGRESAASVLAGYGATKVPEVKEEDYDAVFADAQALLAG